MNIFPNFKNIKINSCGITDCDKSWYWDTGRSGFRDYDLWTVMRGKGRITSEKSSAEVSEGISLLLFPNTRYVGEQEKDAPLMVINVHFQLEEAIDAESGKDFIFRRISDITYFRDLLYRVIRLYNADNCSLAEAVFSAAVVEYFTQQPPKEKIKYGADKVALTQKICDLINTKPAESPTLSSLAKKYGYSPDYLGRVFSETVGISLSEYIANARINQAKFLLSSADMTTEEVSRALGYYDACYFSRQFKKIVGISPGAYRHQKKK